MNPNNGSFINFNTEPNPDFHPDTANADADANAVSHPYAGANANVNSDTDSNAYFSTASYS